MPTQLHTVSELRQLESRLGLQFRDLELLQQALTHESFLNEWEDRADVTETIASSERLEFLGDAVLDLIVAGMFYRQNPDADQGKLSLARSHVVRKETLAHVAREMGLAGHIVLGRGEHLNGAAERDSVLEDAYEAILGAIYLDRGMTESVRFVRDTLGEIIDDVAVNGVKKDPKSAFQELVQHHGFPSPRYRTSIVKENADGRNLYQAWAMLSDSKVGHGCGNSKSKAQKAAASQAMRQFREDITKRSIRTPQDSSNTLSRYGSKPGSTPETAHSSQKEVHNGAVCAVENRGETQPFLARVADFFARAHRAAMVALAGRSN